MSSITSFDVYELYPSTSSISSVILIASNANMAAPTAHPAGPAPPIAPYTASLLAILPAILGATLWSNFAANFAPIRPIAGLFMISFSMSAPASAPTRISVPIDFASLIFIAVAPGFFPALRAQHPDFGSITKFLPHPMWTLGFMAQVSSLSNTFFVSSANPFFISSAEIIPASSSFLDFSPIASPKSFLISSEDFSASAVISLIFSGVESTLSTIGFKTFFFKNIYPASNTIKSMTPTIIISYYNVYKKT